MNVSSVLEDFCVEPSFSLSKKNQKKGVCNLSCDRWTCSTQAVSFINSKGRTCVFVRRGAIMRDGEPPGEILSQ